MTITMKRSRREIIAGSNQITDPTSYKSQSPLKVVGEMCRLAKNLRKHEKLPSNLSETASKLYEDSINLRNQMKNKSPLWRILDKSY
jgi:hypothetical protein